MQEFTLSVPFTFDAAHHLPNHPRCGKTHGHTWTLIVSIRGPIDHETGMVADFSNLKRLVNSSVISELDHKNLNEVVPCIPTCENLAGWIATSLSKHLPEPINQITVQLREGKGGWATYELKLR